MIEFFSMAEARDAYKPGDMIEAGMPVRLWKAGEAWPSHLIVTPPTSAELLARLRAQAKVLIDDRRDEDVRFRALVLVLLDEINVIRSKLVPALTPRTIAQLKTAVRNKIDAGDAD